MTELSPTAGRAIRPGDHLPALGQRGAERLLRHLRTARKGGVLAHEDSGTHKEKAVS